jgi:hypothetical protein
VLRAKKRCVSKFDNLIAHRTPEQQREKIQTSKTLHKFQPPASLGTSDTDTVSSVENNVMNIFHKSFCNFPCIFSMAQCHLRHEYYILSGALKGMSSGRGEFHGSDKHRGLAADKGAPQAGRADVAKGKVLKARPSPPRSRRNLSFSSCAFGAVRDGFMG